MEIGIHEIFKHSNFLLFYIYREKFSISGDNLTKLPASRRHKLGSFTTMYKFCSMKIDFLTQKLTSRATSTQETTTPQIQFEIKRFFPTPLHWVTSQ